MQKTSAPSGASKRNFIIILAIVVIAVGAAIAAIWINSGGASSATVINYDAIPQGRQPDGGFVLGDPSAPITIVAFEDFLCSHCQDYEPTLHEFVADAVASGQARFEYRMLPVVDPVYSIVTAQLTECSEQIEPGTFWKARETLFEIARSERFDGDSARRFADEMGLSYASLLECTDSAGQIQVDTALAQELGVNATPTIMVRYGDGQPQSLPGRPNLAGLRELVAEAQS